MCIEDGSDSMSASLPTCQCGVTGDCPQSLTTMYRALLVYIGLCFVAAAVLGVWVIRDTSLAKRIPFLYRKTVRGDAGFELTDGGRCTSENNAPETGLVVSNDAVIEGGSSSDTK
ncbi:uncharacterized protein LOC124261774 [Haliotis rubra]|uniref:uncharacterized protein LOC124261774 n=1 Tax=Haliotis rubra TaxID=36100 RepID=UPI001EE59207|nr:uncharacterized protein LOC124261774 [Haliotis rubra]